MLKSYKQKLLIVIISLILFSFLVGIIKVEFLLSFLNEDLIKPARIMSYITLSIGSIFLYFIIIIAIYCSFMIITFIKIGEKYNVENFYRAMNYFIYSLFINEFLKLFITLFTFDSTTIHNVEDFNSTIENNTLWSVLLEYSDVIFIFLGCVFFCTNFLRLEKNVKIHESIICVAPLFFSFFIFRYFYS